MRILHTSDWHLGRSFHGFSLHQTCIDFVDEMVQLVEEKQIDAVLISGDVYDQAQPRPDTVALLSQTLTRLVAAGATVIATSGNHDSALRLGFASEILRAGGVYMCTDPELAHRPIELVKSGVTVKIYGIPYLEPRAIAANWQVDSSHEAVLGEAISRIHQDARTRPTHATLVMAHCFAAAGSPSDSERNINVGGAFTVPLSIFDGFDYVALGHLHGKQKLSETVRYSGSPIAYSFSEEKHRKGAWLIEIDETGVKTVEEYLWGSGINLATLSGTLEELTTTENKLKYADTICRITLTDLQRPPQALEKLGATFPFIAELYFKPAGTVTTEEKAHRITEQARPLIEVCDDFYTYVLGRELAPTERADLKDLVETLETSEVPQ